MAEENELLEPPKYDMLIVRFSGDTHTIVLPYCEVANGHITSVDSGNVYIAAKKDNEDARYNMQFKDFLQIMEDSFDLKEITELAIQRAGQFEIIQIL